ncbi:uncharacterized protein LOC122553791 isoform X1 [Chiloscyllium plagiosum]|uniref:uncharacterized protein LOC122553791 isoform X1 n=1 Tax=Chiloscyllium plagiosum TaxID=36176 RepID=UPI001CB86DBE|nr:uncharacterized protein LOC122553791 isoform X1 [Chiloscyllium plagiosum]
METLSNENILDEQHVRLRDWIGVNCRPGPSVRGCCTGRNGIRAAHGKAQGAPPKGVRYVLGARSLWEGGGCSRTEPLPRSGVMGLLNRSRTLRFGLPMLLLITGGSFGLREFTQVRYDVQKVKRKIDPALEAQLNKNKNKISMESEYEKLQQQNLDDWVNIRGPRPWEDSKSYQDQQRKTQNANNIINSKH